MATYVYKCWDCNIEEEYVHSMADMETAVHNCPKCDTPMKRKITGGAGIIFKGDGWPSKQIKQQDQDQHILKARRKAKHLKESGAVPWDEQIKQKDAGPLHDKLESDMRKREQEKLQSGALAQSMDASVKEEK